MDDSAFEQFKLNHYDEVAIDFDRCCEERLRAIDINLRAERPPYPPSHLVTLARVVHVLARRTLVNDHPAMVALSRSFANTGRHGLHRYWIAVFRINDAINFAAKAREFSLREALTGFPLGHWALPSNSDFQEWERAAIHSGADRTTGNRRAVEIMDTFKWALLAAHFDSTVVVSLAEIDSWATRLGITNAGEIALLLQAGVDEAAHAANQAYAARKADEASANVTEAQQPEEIEARLDLLDIDAPWKQIAVEQAKIIYATAMAAGYELKVPQIAKKLVPILATMGVRGPRGPLTAGNIERMALRRWIPPKA